MEQSNSRPEERTIRLTVCRMWGATGAVRAAVLVACLGMAAAGCARPVTVYTPNLIESWQRPASPREAGPSDPRIRLVLYARRTYIDSRPSPSAMITRWTVKTTEKAMRRAAGDFPFLVISNQPSDPDYRLVIEATQARPIDFAKVFPSALTFFLKPYRRRTEVETEAKLYRGDRLLARYTASARTEQAVSLFTLFTVRETSPAITQDTFTDLFLQLPQRAEELAALDRRAVP